MKSTAFHLLWLWAVIAVVVTACLPSSTPMPSPPPPTATSLPPSISELGPTPLPTRTTFTPGELVDYFAQSGDTLLAVAAHFHTSEEEIMAANPALPIEITTLPPGLPMKIPIYYAPLTGTAFHILPDSEFVNSPSAIEFDIQKRVILYPGFIVNTTDYAFRDQRPAWEAVAVLARNYSLHPRMLLALLEYQTHALTKPVAADDEITYPLGHVHWRYRGLYRQLLWAAERLNDGYYGWRTGILDTIELADGYIIRPDPWQNAGTVGLQNLFAGLYGQEGFERAIGPDGFYKTYRELWGDPFEKEIELMEGNLQQPELSLPFLPNRLWDFTAGPHYAWGTCLPWGALDFAPPAVESGCAYSGEWVAAPADGVITRSGEAMVMLDLDGDGDERTGWALFFFHMDTKDRIAEGTVVKRGDMLGHPSCEGGRSTGTHVHIARLYNGEWIPAAGPLAFVLDGWVAGYGDEPYQGTLTKVSKVLTASTLPTQENRIQYEIPH